MNMQGGLWICSVPGGQRLVHIIGFLVALSNNIAILQYNYYFILLSGQAEWSLQIDCDSLLACRSLKAEATLSR